MSETYLLEMYYGLNVHPKVHVLESSSLRNKRGDENGLMLLSWEWVLY
jgi:hypothetical protein